MATPPTKQASGASSNALAKDGGNSFLHRFFIETSWWSNFGSGVLATTVEAVYGRVGKSDDWVTPEELTQLGAMLARGLILILQESKLSALPAT